MFSPTAGFSLVSFFFKKKKWFSLKAGFSLVYFFGIKKVKEFFFPFPKRKTINKRLALSNKPLIIILLTHRHCEALLKQSTFSSLRGLAEGTQRVARSNLLYSQRQIPNIITRGFNPLHAIQRSTQWACRRHAKAKPHCYQIINLLT